MGLGGVAIAILPSIICLKLTFSDGLGGGANRGTGSDTDDATAREIAFGQVSLRYDHA